MIDLATIALRQSHVAYLANTGAMSPTERWLFGLGPLPGSREADLHAQDVALHDVAPTTATGVRLVHARRQVRRVAASDQRVGGLAVHDDHAQAQALKPPTERLRESPDGAASVSSSAALLPGSCAALELRHIAVGATDPVVQLLLADAERLASAAQQGGNLLVAGQDHGSNSHAALQHGDAPRASHGSVRGA